MKNDTAFIVLDKSMYFYDKEEKCIQPLNICKNSKIIYPICKKINKQIPARFVNKDLLKMNKLVFTDSAFSLSLFKLVSKMKEKENLYLYFMNIINSQNEHYMKYFMKKNIFTFDYLDALKYGINYKHTPYSRKGINFANEKIIYDTVFLGRMKNREESIVNIKNELDKLGLNNRFMVLGAKDNSIKIDKLVNYNEYLRILNQSKCIVEINIASQSGCSLRFMESLFLQKKIITTNKNIVNDPYYSKNNVFIWGVDDKKELKKFLSLPYNVNYTVNLKDLYFDNWIESF